MSTYGYARVSTCDQNEDRQIIAMEKFGVKRSAAGYGRITVSIP